MTWIHKNYRDIKHFLPHDPRKSLVLARKRHSRIAGMVAGVVFAPRLTPPDPARTVAGAFLEHCPA
jgi:hypothetical protein